MAGNVLVIKHASNVPQSALAFAQMLEEAGAPKGAYTNIFASTDQVGRLIEDTRVRGVTVTGSEGAGAAIAERAGRKLKKSVLELGGSDPLFILEEAPFEATLDNAMWGRMNTTGQSCTASKRVIVVGKERGCRKRDAPRGLSRVEFCRAARGAKPCRHDAFARSTPPASASLIRVPAQQPFPLLFAADKPAYKVGEKVTLAVTTFQDEILIPDISGSTSPPHCRRIAGMLSALRSLQNQGETRCTGFASGTACGRVIIDLNLDVSE
jgi:Aldehyde dehydrogenase family